eukprot:7391992-Prymnesium_polylepis.3
MVNKKPTTERGVTPSDVLRLKKTSLQEQIDQETLNRDFHMQEMKSHTGKFIKATERKKDFLEKKNQLEGTQDIKISYDDKVIVNTESAKSSSFLMKSKPLIKFLGLSAVSIATNRLLKRLSQSSSSSAFSSFAEKKKLAEEQLNDSDIDVLNDSDIDVLND